MSDETDDGEEESEEGDLDSFLSEGVVPPKDRYYCAGAKRTDEETGKKWCNYRAPKKWYGVCPKCHRPFACLPFRKGKASSKRISLGQATMDAHKEMVYFSSGIHELDKVLNGGFVYGKLLMIGAKRGCGKTTMLLQAADGFAQGGRKSYFASGEMDGNTNVDYAKRLGIVNENITLFCDPQGLNVEDIFEDVLAVGAKLLVIDSLQLCCVSGAKGDLGKPTMIDAVINMVSSFCQEKKRACIMISHLNKVGDYAGTETGQHLVDGLLLVEHHCVLNPDGSPTEATKGIRKIRMAEKSRQGRSDITSLVELTDEGIRPPSLKALRELSKLQLA